jgi:hypothetical protein
MRSALLATAVMTCLMIGSVGTPAQALPISMPTVSTVDIKPLAEPVGYRNYCGRWVSECRARWGLGTWRFRRCLAIRGCI